MTAVTSKCMHCGVTTDFATTSQDPKWSMCKSCWDGHVPEHGWRAAIEGRLGASTSAALTGFVVICRGEWGRWAVARQSKLPMTEEEAVQYARSISPLREPLVCKCCPDWERFMGY
jgi:hypothetical protein